MQPTSESELQSNDRLCLKNRMKRNRRRCLTPINDLHMHIHTCARNPCESMCTYTNVHQKIRFKPSCLWATFRLKDSAGCPCPFLSVVEAKECHQLPASSWQHGETFLVPLSLSPSSLGLSYVLRSCPNTDGYQPAFHLQCSFLLYHAK